MTMYLFQFDIRSQEQVEEVLKGADCVYHLASYGMSGREMVNKLTINIGELLNEAHMLFGCLKNI